MTTVKIKSEAADEGAGLKNDILNARKEMASFFLPSLFKSCTKCGQVKLTSEFYRQPLGKYGVTSKCLECCRAVGRERSKTHRHQARERLSKWRDANPEHNKATGRRNYANNKASRIASVIRYQQRNPEAKIKADKRYRDRHKDKQSKWRKDNAGLLRAHAGIRRARHLSATPQWLTNSQRLVMMVIYKASTRITRCTGIKHHVDHIEALQAVNSCGLHVPWNLQIITASANLKKGNKSIERA